MRDGVGGGGNAHIASYVDKENKVVKLLLVLLQLLLVVGGRHLPGQEETSTLWEDDFLT